jgi:hypothetical protein
MAGVGGMRSFGGVHGGFAGNRFGGIRGYSAWRNGGWGGRRFIGGYSGYGYGGWGYPYDAYAADVGLVGLGLGLAEAATGYCGPYDYSYGACGAPAYYSYGPAYSGYSTPINAWSW